MNTFYQNMLLSFSNHIQGSIKINKVVGKRNSLTRIFSFNYGRYTILSKAFLISFHFPLKLIRQCGYTKITTKIGLHNIWSKVTNDRLRESITFKLLRLCQQQSHYYFKLRIQISTANENPTQKQFELSNFSDKFEKKKFFFVLYKYIFII